MIASILSTATSIGTAGTGGAGGMVPTASAPSVDAFSRSMEHHSGGRLAATDGAQAAAVQPPPAGADAAKPVPGVPPAVDAQAQSRARDALELNGTGAHGGGDAILQGLQKLRGVFDRRESIVTRLMGSSVVDTRTLMAMQMEVAQFSLLVDVTSKLTGKSTQAFDTLMKGQ